MQRFETFRQFEGFEPRVVVERVEHQWHVRTKRFAYSGARSQVALDAWCARQRWLPGVQLEGGVAALFASNGIAGVRLGSIQTAFEIVTNHGAGIGRHFVAGSTEQTVHWLPEHFAYQIP